KREKRNKYPTTKDTKTESKIHVQAREGLKGKSPESQGDFLTLCKLSSPVIKRIPKTVVSLFARTWADQLSEAVHWLSFFLVAFFCVPSAGVTEPSTWRVTTVSWETLRCEPHTTTHC